MYGAAGGEVEPWALVVIRRLHRDAQAERSHVRPHLFDVREAVIFLAAEAFLVPATGKRARGLCHGKSLVTAGWSCCLIRSAGAAAGWVPPRCRSVPRPVGDPAGL